MTSAPVKDAITRLNIVRSALDGTVPTDNPLAAQEAFSAVANFLYAVAEDTKDCDCGECVLRNLAALNAITLGSALQVLGLVPGTEHPITERAFSTFALSVEVLVDIYEKEGQE